MAIINQYEVKQEFGNSVTDQSNLTVVIDTTSPDKSAHVMKSFPGEKLKVPPFVLRRRDMARRSEEADLIHFEIELMRKMVHPNLQMIRDVSFYSVPLPLIMLYLAVPPLIYYFLESCSMFGTTWYNLCNIVAT